MNNIKFPLGTTIHDWLPFNGLVTGQTISEAVLTPKENQYMRITHSMKDVFTHVDDNNGIIQVYLRKGSKTLKIDIIPHGNPNRH
jgi:hypothetical protein